jgi:predicted RNA polymerase sigma factor
MEVPRGESLAARLDSVLRVVYLLFNEGYAATSGDDLMRPSLCEEALRLGRVLAGLMPEAEVLGLVALMELQASRAAARVDAGGKPVLLTEQDRSRWDQLLIRRGLAGLERAAALPVAPGPYRLQAMIAACHARARSPEQTDWREIASLYGRLVILAGSPVVQLNRAVAVGMAEGPEAGLALVDEVVEDGSLTCYHLVPAVRADLLERLGRITEAAAEFERAAAMSRNAPERTLLRERAARCRGD